MEGGREGCNQHPSPTRDGNKEVGASFNVHLNPGPSRYVPLSRREGVRLDMPGLAVVGIEDGEGRLEGAVEEGDGEEVALFHTDGKGFLGFTRGGEGQEFQRALREGGREGRRRLFLMEVRKREQKQRGVRERRGGHDGWEGGREGGRGSMAVPRRDGGRSSGTGGQRLPGAWTRWACRWFPVGEGEEDKGRGGGRENEGEGGNEGGRGSVRTLREPMALVLISPLSAS